MKRSLASADRQAYRLANSEQTGEPCPSGSGSGAVMSHLKRNHLESIWFPVVFDRAGAASPRRSRGAEELVEVALNGVEPYQMN